MAIKAFVLVNADPAVTKGAIKQLPSPASTITGRFDAIVSIETESPRTLAEFVLSQVRTVEGVLKTETLPVLKEFSKPAKADYPIRAYILIKADPKKTTQVFNNLTPLDDVVAVSTVTGRFDLVVQFGARNWDTLADSILNKIRTIDGINYTETLIATQ